MKIALLTDSYIPAPNGTSISVETLRRSLLAAGHEPWVFGPAYPGLKIKEDRIVSLPGIFSFPDRFKPRTWPINAPKPKVLKEAGFDIVHSHHFYSPFRYALEFAEDAGIPHAVTFYRYFPELNKKNSITLTSPYQKSINRMLNIANNSQCVLAPSKANKEYLQSFGVTNRIEVAPVGVFTKDYSSYPPGAIYEKFKIPRQRELLLYVGRLDNEGQIEFLLKAFKIIWKAIDDIHLLIIGGGVLEREVKELISRQSFSEYITLTGYLPKQQVNKIYGVADLFVYPKTLDPEPMCVIESLAGGTPVVAVEGMGIRDFLKHNEEGLITKPQVEDFAKGVIELLRREKLRLELSLRARARAKEFRASNTTHFLLELYDSILTGKKPAKLF